YGVRGETASASSRRIDDILALCGIAELSHRRPHELSGGQAQRVAIARAVATGPRLLLLDEPVGALDLAARSRFRRDLRSIVRALNAAVVLVTHDRTDAIALGDQLIVVAEGRVRQVGAALDVF